MLSQQNQSTIHEAKPFINEWKMLLKQGPVTLKQESQQLLKTSKIWNLETNTTHLNS